MVRQLPLGVCAFESAFISSRASEVHLCGAPESTFVPDRRLAGNPAELHISSFATLSRAMKPEIVSSGWNQFAVMCGSAGNESIESSSSGFHSSFLGHWLARSELKPAGVRPRIRGNQFWRPILQQIGKSKQNSNQEPKKRTTNIILIPRQTSIGPETEQ
jgi:hypothetical protein